MPFNLFGPASKDDIRVGYISTDRGFVDGVSVCGANDYAKKNPGARFIFRTRDEIKYIGINDVNKLTPDDAIPKTSAERDCPGVQLESDCGPVKVYFYGGGGVGAKANPVIGKDGSLLAVDLVSGGFGYQYAPVTEVKDNCGIGAGSVVRSVLGEIAESVEYYDQEEDFEVYDTCPPTESGYGRIYSPDGKDIGEWDPTLYANLSKDPIRREIKAYQDFLSSLRGGYRVNIGDNIVHQWWTTRKETPLSVTSPSKTTRVKHDVRHPGWGGEYGTSEYKDVTFKVFTHFGKKENPLVINFTSEDNSHKFSIKADSFKNNTRGESISIKVKPNMIYKISSQGQYKGKGTEVGLIDKIGRKSEEVGTKNTNKVLSGNAIFADFLETTNDNDDLQVETTLGKFTATRIGSGKGRSTYDLKYILNDGSVYKPSKTDDSFMNNNAISPVPPSNVTGSDFAGILFTMEWEKEFPYDGDYIFKGMADNIGTIYLDNELLFRTVEFRKDMPPTQVKKTIKSGVHRIRADLYNVPFTEKQIVSSTSGNSLDVVYKGLNSKNKSLNVRGNKVLLKDGDGDDTNSTFSIVSSDSGVNAKFSPDGRKIEYFGSGKITVQLEWNDRSSIAGVAVESITVGGKKLTQNGTSGSQKQTITVSKSQSNSTSSTQSESQVRNVFNTVDYIGKANRKLWKTNIYNRGGFINEYGVCPFDTNLKLEDNPYAGTHKIIWDNIDFPIDGNYIIELEVDDNVTLTFEGPQENIVITKKGFNSSAQSTGKSTESRYFKRGKYKLTADLQQIPGGAFSFDDTTKGINPMALAINITSSVTGQEIVSPRSWNENPMGVALTIDAPLPPIPQEPIVEQEGRCPRNPIWTTRYPNASEKWYPVNYSSPKTVTETVRETTNPVSSDTQSVDFSVYGQGAFKDLAFVFTAVNGKHTFTLKGVDKNKKSRTETIKILKNVNYVVRAKENSEKYTSVEQGLIKGGSKDKEQGIGESKKIFADYITSGNDNDDIQITASSGIFISSNRRKASGSTRSTFDLTYKLTAAPGEKSQTTSKTTTYDVPGWSKFMNRYAISPVPPLAQQGSDGAGVVYRNSWKVDIPYDGFYALRGTVDNIGKVLIDGKEIGTKTFKSPYKFRQGIPDPDPLTLGIPAINNAFLDGLTSGDILAEAAKQGLKINPNAQPLLKTKKQTSGSLVSPITVNLDSFGEENPKSTKIFLTKGMHTIQVEVENQKSDTYKTIDKKIFDTADWVVSQSINNVQSKINAKFIQKNGKYFLEVTGSGSGEITFIMDVDDSPLIAGLAATQVIIPSDTKKITFTRKVDDTFGAAFGLKSYYEPVQNIKEFGIFTAGKTYGPIEIIGATSGAGTPVVSNNKLGLLDSDGSDENIKIIITDIKNYSTSQSSGGLSGGTVKDAVTYSGVTLTSYRNGSLGPFLTPTFTTDDDYRTNNVGRSWISKWENVDFPETGKYELKAEADDEVIVKIDGEVVGVARVFEGVRYFSFNVTKGKRTVELEFNNIPSDNRSTFESNPVVFNVIITKKVSVASDIGPPWTSNPIGISAILIPPPCPKIIKGKGVIKEVIVDDPGNGNPDLTPPGAPTIPVGVKLDRVRVVNPGINYNCGIDRIQITPDNGAVLDYRCDTFGRIVEVTVVDSGTFVSTYPEITIQTETGINFEATPILTVVRDPITFEPERLIQVTDLAGLKQTGYYDGRAYYGAVFYKDGIRYAGYYETPGELVQIYDTLQESIDAQVTTPPTAILRQGTDTNSNNPRLNIPGTPENLI